MPHLSGSAMEYVIASALLEVTESHIQRTFAGQEIKFNGLGDNVAFVYALATSDDEPEFSVVEYQG